MEPNFESTDLFCRINVQPQMPFLEFAAFIARCAGGSSYMNAIRARTFDISVFENDDFDAEMSRTGEDRWLYFRYTLQANPSGGVLPKDYVAAIGALLNSLWASRIDAVASCDFDEQLPLNVRRLKWATVPRPDEVTVREAEEPEESLRRRNAELEQRVQELTAALDRSMAELRERTDEFEQFSFIARDDLRGPLRTLVILPQRLARAYAGKLDVQADDWIKRIIEGATRMQRVIEDLLQYAYVIRRDRAFGPTDCAVVARDACANLQAAIEERGAVVEIGDLPTVLGNQQQLMLLYQNLVGNAVKFRDPGRPVRVDVGAQREGDGWLCWVRDNGIGIDEKYLRRIFGLGERLHRASEYAGTGYGLAMCEKIVTVHRGQIWATSKSGQGSTFCFTLPAAPRN